jgi:hypothetical protein
MIERRRHKVAENAIDNFWKVPDKIDENAEEHDLTIEEEKSEDNESLGSLKDFIADDDKIPQRKVPYRKPCYGCHFKVKSFKSHTCKVRHQSKKYKRLFKKAMLKLNN